MPRNLTITCLFAMCIVSAQAQWQPRGLNGGDAIGFAETSEGVFCAVQGSGVYRTTNEALNWEEARDGLDNVAMHSITDDGVNGLLVVTSTGLWRKPPSERWHRINDSLFSGATLRFVKRVTSTDIFLSARQGRNFLSRDNGKTWEEVSRIDSLISTNATDYAAAPDGKIWAACMKLYYSTDWGQSWHVSEFSKQNNKWVASIAFNQEMVVIVGDGAWYSKDNIATWTELDITGSTLNLHSVIEYNRNFYASGASFVVMIPWYDISMKGISNFKISSYSSAVVQSVFVSSTLMMLAGVKTHGVYKRDELSNAHPYSVEWTLRSDGLNAMWISSLGVTPRGGLIYVDGVGADYQTPPGQETRKSDDNGYGQYLGIIEKHRDGRTMVGVHYSPPRGSDYDLFKFSDDDGATWTDVSNAFTLMDLDGYSGSRAWAESIGMLDTDSDSMLICIRSNLYSLHANIGGARSLKMGRNFSSTRIWFGADYIVALNPIIYFDAADSTWKFPKLDSEHIYANAMSRSESGAFYAVTYNGVVKSLDDAKMFFVLTPFFDGVRLNNISVINDRQLVVSDSNNIYATNDGGTTWSRINRNLPPSKIADIDADIYGNIYVGFNGAGIWSCPWELATTDIQDEHIQFDDVEIENAMFNAAQQRIEVQIKSHSSDPFSVTLFDVRGIQIAEQIVQYSTPSKSISFSTRALSSGAYYIVARTADSFDTQLLVVTR